MEYTEKQKCATFYPSRRKTVLLNTRLCHHVFLSEKDPYQRALIQTPVSLILCNGPLWLTLEM